MIDKSEVRQVLEAIAHEYGGPLDALTGILDDVFDGDDTFASGRVERSLLRKALKSKIP